MYLLMKILIMYPSTTQQAEFAQGALVKNYSIRNRPMAIVEAENVKYAYKKRDDEGEGQEPVFALDGVSLSAMEGEFIAILGHNGSGKSTFAKHLNALLVPDEGTVFIDGMDTCKDENTLSVRETAGMVFQNPDNQMVASVVEEEVGFGPENIGVPTEEIWERV